MSWVARGVAAAALTAGGIAVGRAWARRGPIQRWPIRPVDEGPAGWYVVTVNRPPEEVAPAGRLPEPVAQLGADVEVRLRRAPGGRGTEVAARLPVEDRSGLAALSSRLTGDDPRHAVRWALHQVKQLAETGEVFGPDATDDITGPAARRR